MSTFDWDIFCSIFKVPYGSFWPLPNNGPYPPWITKSSAFGNNIFNLAANFITGCSLLLYRSFVPIVIITFPTVG